MNKDRSCQIPEVVRTLAPVEVECVDCALDPMCLLLDYAEHGSGVPEGILLRRQAVATGERLYQEGQVFEWIYAVKSGSFKSFIAEPGGREGVVGFYFAGDLIGAEAIAEQRYPCGVRALEPSQVCMLRLEHLEQAGRSVEALQEALIKMLGMEIALSRRVTAALTGQSAEQRLAAFLLSVSERLKNRGFSSLTLTLRMSRSDIGSYLGLARETVSRLLMKFQRGGVILLRKKQLRLLDYQGLARIASHD